MTMEFWRAVMLPFLQPYAQNITLDVPRRGFYPRGGGEVRLHVVPTLTQATWRTQQRNLPALDLPARGDLQQLQIYSCASAYLQERKVATRQASACYNALPRKPQNPQIEYAATPSPGSSITVVAEYAHTRLGADVLGEQGKRAEQVGQEAAEKLAQEMQTAATVDVHTADNLMVWVALFGGGYTFAETTGHIATNAWVIEQFLPGALHVEAQKLAGLRQ
jgi:RNA 3'-terminal phosphate cyclase